MTPEARTLVLLNRSEEFAATVLREAVRVLVALHGIEAVTAFLRQVGDEVERGRHGQAVAADSNRGGLPPLGG